jgi:Probable lipoprotein LpqN
LRSAIPQWHRIRRQSSRWFPSWRATSTWAKVLEYAPGEIQNLPGYEGASEGSPSTLSGFDATQIGGLYTRNGVRRAIAQKTVVIPGQDGLYVLQLNADGTEAQMGTLMDATTAIDEQAKITP